MNLKAISAIALILGSTLLAGTAQAKDRSILIKKGIPGWSQYESGDFRVREAEERREQERLEKKRAEERARDRRIQEAREREQERKRRGFDHNTWYSYFRGGPWWES